MGQQLVVRASWDHNVFRPLGTLGHPRSSLGTTAFTTNHGIFRQFQTVYAGVFRPSGNDWVVTPGSAVGYIANAAFIPAVGIDVSYLRLFPNVRISTQIPGTSSHITNFFGTANTLNSVQLITSRGRLNGMVTNLYRDVNIFVNGRYVLMRNMLVAQIGGAGEGDSGAALIQGTTVVGTLFAGIRGRVYFSRAPVYINIR